MVQLAEPDISPITRFDRTEVDRWCEFLVARYREQHPAAQAGWIARLLGLIGQNECLAVHNNLAAGLFIASRHPITGQTVVSEVFALARGTRKIPFGRGTFRHVVDDHSDEEEALVRLLDYAIGWAATMDATIILGNFCDMPPKRLMEEYDGETERLDLVRVTQHVRQTII